MIKDKKNYNILIIEDNAGDFMLIEDYLEEQIADPRISHVKNLKDARSLLTDHKTSYDIILLDLSLPDKSGETLITEINSICSGCPVIVLTGYEDIEFSIKSLSMGIADYLLKDDINATSLYKSIIFNLERKKTSAALEESEKRYSDLFHLSPQPMWVYALDSFRFQDVNEAALTHYGYTREEFLGMMKNDISAKENDLMPEKVVEAIAEEESPLLNAGIKHRKKNGEIIQVELHGSIIDFKGRKAEIIVANDITEKSRHICAIQEQNKKLSEIAWMQSHVIRAPLARLMGLVDLIKNHPMPDSDKDELLDHLIDSANELDCVIGEISDKT